MIRFFKKTKVDSDRRIIAAKQLLETPMFNELIETLESRYFDAWYNTKPDEEKERERLFVKLQTIREAKDHLQNILKHDKLREDIVE